MGALGLEMAPALPPSLGTAWGHPSAFQQGVFTGCGCVQEVFICLNME